MMPSAIAGAKYLATVLRDTPRLLAISLTERPACQCIRISAMSTTWNAFRAMIALSSASP